jgi:pSer/pThr/pTyr-binding forkhead associated (FHA) protein
MSKLTIYKDGALVGNYELNKERVRIGRKGDCELRLNHPTVSSEHALIVNIRNDSFLEDLDSTNGTRVNQKSVKKCVLQDGDQIRVGKYLLQYVFEPALGATSGSMNTVQQIDPLTGQVMLDEDSEEYAHQDPAQTQFMTTLAEEPVIPVTARQRAPGGENGAMPLAGLQILAGPGSGNELVLEKALTTLGKPGVQTAVITRRPQGYFLSHLDGVEFPLVNGTPISSHAHMLQDHDIVELAGIKMEYYLK